MKNILFFLLIISFSITNCNSSNTDFSNILQQSCIFLDTVESIQFDRIYTYIDPNSEDTQITEGNVYLKYFDLSKINKQYTGIYQAYYQNYMDNSISIKKELTKDSIIFYYFTDNNFKINKELQNNHQFDGEYCDFLNAKNLREHLKFIGDNLSHYYMKDTFYNGTFCYFISIYLKDNKSVDLKQIKEIYIVRKSDYLPIYSSFYGTLENNVIMWYKYEVSSIHINQPYRDSFVNTTKKNEFLNNIPNLIQDNSFVATNLPFENIPLYDINGNKISIADYKGHVIVLDFWYIGCFYCLKLIPEINELNSRYKNVIFLGVNSRNKSQLIDKFQEKNNINYSTFNDFKQLEKNLKVNGFPTTIIIDKKGKILNSVSGYSKDAINKIELIIKEAEKQN